MPPAPLPLSAEVTADLMRYLSASPSPYHAVLEGARRLADVGFVGVDERASWVDIAAGGPGSGGAHSGDQFPRRGFMIRGGALLAWFLPEGAALRDGVRIIGAHTDSPNLRIKPIAETGSAGWRQLGIEIYGGPLLNSWLDRDLGLSGRVALRSGDVRLIRIDEPLARVPQLAIHLDREVNERGVQLDKQLHLTPVWGIGDVQPGQLAELIAKRLGVTVSDILASDLMLHDLTPPALIGADRELLASARLDNLCSSHGALTALASVSRRPEAHHGALIALFDHEEVGSETATGAGGPLLPMVLNRLVRATGGGPEDMDRLC
ncbi:MAG: M18 family aminopeptidase, partial [Acidimicrobiia bacterium]